MPIVHELSSVPDPGEALRRLRSWDSPILFESSSQRAHLGRYSFLTADPVRRVEIQRANYGVDPLLEVEREIERFRQERIEGLPPFQGGAAGLLGFELGGAWERLPRSGRGEFGLPDLAVGIYDWVLASDRELGRAWIIALGLMDGLTEGVANEEAAQRRVDWVREALKGGEEKRESDDGCDLDENELLIVPTSMEGVYSDFSRREYLDRVQRVIDYIQAGDVFQVNLSQRLLSRAEDSSVDLYQRLRRINPAPFSGYFSWSGADRTEKWSIVSASPERFMAVRGREVETRPIKGTRRRSPHPAADLFVKDELRESNKDLAENTMIVDLLRNDLSRVCRPGSIRVPQFCGVETYQTVQHLVSEIRGSLEEGRKPFDLIRAAFPGGSITGAPKVRAVEIIGELEPTVRGPYCGALFYHGFDGAFDSNLLIRTFIQSKGWRQFPVGGGIVSDSQPEAEYDETLHKAAGLLSALKA